MSQHRPAVTVRLLRTNDAAKYIAVSPWKIRTLVRDGKLPYVDDGNGPWRFDLHDLDTYIDRNRQQGE